MTHSNCFPFHVLIWPHLKNSWRRWRTNASIWTDAPTSCANSVTQKVANWLNFRPINLPRFGAITIKTVSLSDSYYLTVLQLNVMIEIRNLAINLPIVHLYYSYRTQPEIWDKNNVLVIYKNENSRRIWIERYYIHCEHWNSVEQFNTNLSGGKYILDERGNWIKLNESALSYPRRITSAMQCNSGRVSPFSPQPEIKSLSNFFPLVSILTFTVSYGLRMLQM